MIIKMMKKRTIVLSRKRLRYHAVYTTADLAQPKDLLREVHPDYTFAAQYKRAPRITL
jgi:hypothetical protein